MGEYLSSGTNEREVNLVLEFDLWWLVWIVWSTVDDQRVESILEFGAIRTKDAGIPFCQRSVLGFIMPKLQLSSPKEM